MDRDRPSSSMRKAAVTAESVYITAILARTSDKCPGWDSNPHWIGV